MRYDPMDYLSTTKIKITTRLAKIHSRWLTGFSIKFRAINNSLIHVQSVATTTYPQPDDCCVFA